MMTWNRAISAFIAISYLVAAFVARGGEGAGKMALFLVLPIFCIWFSDAMGGYTGMTSWMISVSPSPPIFVRILGWLLLLLPVVLGIIAYASA